VFSPAVLSASGTEFDSGSPRNACAKGNEMCARVSSTSDHGKTRGQGDRANTLVRLAPAGCCFTQGAHSCAYVFSAPGVGIDTRRT
jgi:hypothetical protein